MPVARREKGVWLAGRRIRRVLVRRLRFMGDVILTTPLLRALKRADPGLRVAYLVESSYEGVLEGNPNVDTVLTLERHPGGLRAEAGQILDLRRRMRSFRPDLAIDLLGIPKSAALLALSGAPLRIGGPYRLRKHLYTHVVQHPVRAETAVEYHLRSLEPLGLSGPWQPEDLRTEVYLSDEEKAWAETFLRSRLGNWRGAIVGLHPGATWPAKRWFPERFGALARRIAEELGARVVVTVGPGEHALAEDVRRHAGGRAHVLPVLPLRRLAAVLGALSVYVTNDCGPLHLSVAVGTPTVGLFGPGEPNIWFPYDPRLGHVALHHPCPLHPCHRDFCDNPVCWYDLSVDEVLDAVAGRLRR
ncbi:MAG TPA: glycosyltransferase family 9 protein [Bacteroidetes bacterium]|nr:glycosyltransferase family 9 protein [Bacteroidota bacterium]